MTPSPRQVQAAFTDLAVTARQLLELEPNMPTEDAKLWQNMLEAEAEGDPFETLDQLVHAVVSNEVFVAGVKEYRRRLYERQERLEKTAERLRDMVKRFLEHLQLAVLIRPTYSATVSTGAQHVVPSAPPEQMPPRFQRISIDWNKEALGEALKAGEENVPASWSNAEPKLTIRVR